MSLSTTNLGPRVSINTEGSYRYDPAKGKFVVASTASFLLVGKASLTGNISSTGTFDASGGRVFSRITVGSATSALLNDGEYGFFQHGVSAISLAVRSGQTTYWFASGGAAVA